MGNNEVWEVLYCMRCKGPNSPYNWHVAPMATNRGPGPDNWQVVFRGTFDEAWILHRNYAHLGVNRLKQDLENGIALKVIKADLEAKS